MSRNSPTKHAADTEIGTIMRGNDGDLYIVDKRSDNTHFWKKSPYSDKKPPRSWPTTSKNSIAVGEVSSSIIYNKGHSVHLKVNDNFLNILAKKPKYMTCQRGNAYVFGHHKYDWIYIGNHGNDVAQTGVINLTNIHKNEVENIQDYDKWLNIFEKSGGRFEPWDKREHLSKVRNNISPRILFVGDTFGGDVGADVFVHLDDNREIDGLIIENHCWGIYKD